jgi:UDP-N-acetyl-D-mannosaminuronic acid dehydrogenase
MARILCVGVGHVGLPLSLKFWAAGHEVSLVDIDTAKIESLRRREMPFHEEGCDTLLRRATSEGRFWPLTYVDSDFESSVENAECIVLTLGTPLGTDYTFRYDQYFDVLKRMIPHLRRGVTIMVRSTVAPHFTRNVVTARIAADRRWVPGVDFYPSFCPERLVQGHALADIDELPEIIGADDPATFERASSIFLSLRQDKVCVRVSTVEAELAKLFLNTFRYTVFGLANEFALIAEQYGADVHSALRAANLDYPRGGIPRPGPSRGPCLGKDTATLAFSTNVSLISHAAIKTNENVVLYAAHELRAALGSYAGRRVGILGYSFKADTDDTRDNLTAPLVNLLDREGAATSVFDPLVACYANPDVLRGSDALVLMTAHSVFRDMSEEAVIELCDRRRHEIFVFDLWNVWPWADRIFGKGSDEQYENSRYRRMRFTDAPSHSSSA